MAQIPVYSMMFARGTVPAGTTTAGPTVPTGYVWILSDIELRGVGAAGAEFIVSLSSGLVAFGVTLPAGQTDAYWRGHAVFNAGDQLMWRSVGPAFNYYVSGYQLTIPTVTPG